MSIEKELARIAQEIASLSLRAEYLRAIGEHADAAETLNRLARARHRLDRVKLHERMAMRA